MCTYCTVRESGFGNLIDPRQSTVGTTVSSKHKNTLYQDRHYNLYQYAVDGFCALLKSPNLGFCALLKSPNL
jgi:hypothetical protein